MKLLFSDCYREVLCSIHRTNLVSCFIFIVLTMWRHQFH